jgi:hypothetical protein
MKPLYSYQELDHLLRVVSKKQELDAIRLVFFDDINLYTQKQVQNLAILYNIVAYKFLTR